MSTDEKIIKNKMGRLKLVLGRVSEAADRSPMMCSLPDQSSASVMIAQRKHAEIRS